MLYLHDEDFSLLRTVKQLSSSLNEECFIGSVLFLHCSMTSFLEKSGAERPHAVTSLRLPEHLRNSPRRCILQGALGIIVGEDSLCSSNKDHH